ncbi:MAG: ParB N-terminal domain-containing protein [Candidatus Pacebacteria bacterium]|nr:ParB N-terminal domain-containing protein [Candidatus Paceibacterota bacterium]
MTKQSESAVSSTQTSTSIRIRGVDVPVVMKQLEQTTLRFYPENPRVYSVLHASGKPPSQEDIQSQLLELEHVKELIVSIRINKGLLEPLMVKDTTFEVLEGNSRLAAYRYLAKSDPVKWGMVKCTILPQDIDDSLVFTLLGEFHIKGKKDWAPYEQAGFLYRRFTKHNADLKALAAEIGMSSQRVKHLVDVYQFMSDKNENDVSRWSYYDEYLRSTKIRRVREDHPELDDMIVNKIRSEEITRAMDLRDQLPVICSTPKVLNKFLAKTQSFETAYESAVSQGGDSAHLKTVKRFREWVTRQDTENQLQESEGKIRSSAIFELQKIEARVRNLLKKMQV